MSERATESLIHNDLITIIGPSCKCGRRKLSYYFDISPSIKVAPLFWTREKRCMRERENDARVKKNEEQLPPPGAARRSPGASLLMSSSAKRPTRCLACRFALTSFSFSHILYFKQISAYQRVRFLDYADSSHQGRICRLEIYTEMVSAMDANWILSHHRKCNRAISCVHNNCSYLHSIDEWYYIQRLYMNSNFFIHCQILIFFLARPKKMAAAQNDSSFYAI